MSIGEKQSYRNAKDLPTERAVLEREWLSMRLALAMPSRTAEALRQAQSVLRNLSFKDSKVTAALEAIDAAMKGKP